MTLGKISTLWSSFNENSRIHLLFLPLINYHKCFPTQEQLNQQSEGPVMLLKHLKRITVLLFCSYENCHWSTPDPSLSHRNRRVAGCLTAHLELKYSDLLCRQVDTEWLWVEVPSCRFELWESTCMLPQTLQNLCTESEAYLSLCFCHVDTSVPRTQQSHGWK